MDDDKKTCAWCNGETALALFGVLIGLVFIGIGLDTLRRIRMETSGRDASMMIEGETVD